MGEDRDEVTEVPRWSWVGGETRAGYLDVEPSEEEPRDTKLLEFANVTLILDLGPENTLLGIEVLK